MSGERASRGGLERCELDQWLDETLASMPAWVRALMPDDLSFDLRMRRQVLSCVPEVLTREARRQRKRWWRWAAVAATVLLLVGAVGYGWRGEVAPVVAVAGTTTGQAHDARQVISVPVLTLQEPMYAAARTLQAASAQAPGASAPDASAFGMAAPEVAPDGSAGEASTPTRAGPTKAAPASDVEAKDKVMAAGGLPEGGPVEQGRLLEKVAFAGSVDGQQVLVTAGGRVWRYVDGSLVGGEKVFPGQEAARSLMVLPGKDGPIPLWTDSNGRVYKGENTTSGGILALSEGLPDGDGVRVRRLAVVPGRGTPVQVLGGVSLPDEKGYRLQLWLLDWKNDKLTLGSESPALYRGPGEADVTDLAAYRSGRGLTVYVALEVGNGYRYYLAEWRGERLRWQELERPLFLPGTAVASAGGRLAGIDASSGVVSVLEWRANQGWRSWLRPGVYTIRPVGITVGGDDVTRVFFFNTKGEGDEDLLLVRRTGLVGYVDGTLVSRR